MRLYTYIVASLAVIFYAFSSFAAEGVESGVGLIDTAINAGQSGVWTACVAAIIMLVIWVGRKALDVYEKQLSTNTVRWVVAVMGILSGVASALYALPGDAIWYKWLNAIIVGGLINGGLAAGFWSLLGKKVLPEPKKKE